MTLTAAESKTWMWEEFVCFPWNKTFGQPQSEFDKLSGDSRGGCGALQWEWGGSDLWDSLLRVLLP